MTLQASIDGGLTFQPCKDAGDVDLSLSAAGIISFSVGPCKLRATMAGSTVAAGTAQVETATLVGPVATTASADLTVFTLPVAGDKIFFTSPAGVQTVFTFVTSGVLLSQIPLSGLTTAADVAAAIAAKTVTGLSVSDDGAVVTITPEVAGASGNGWAVESVGAWAQKIAVTAGGRDAGTLTASGMVAVTITSAVVVGSPVTINVPVGAGDTLNQWAAKVEQGLIASAALAPHYAVGRFANAVTLTRLSPFAANDATLNIAVANGTPSPGITAAASSANTTAGVVTAPNVLVSVQKR